MGVSSLSIKKKWSDQKKKLARKRKPLLNGTEGSTGIQMQVQLRSVV
jgi:hypothetical protein